MLTIDTDDPLPNQVRTSNKKEDSGVAPDTFYDAVVDDLFVVNEFDEQAQTANLGYYWDDNTTVSLDSFADRLDSGRYGQQERGLVMEKNARFQEFVLEAFKELVDGREPTETFEPMGLTFVDIRSLILIEFGPDIRDPELFDEFDTEE